MWFMFCTDQQYVVPTAVALYSLAGILTAADDARVAVVLDRVPAELGGRLGRFGKRLGIDLELVDAAAIGFDEHARIERHGHVSTAAHLCLFADRVLPPSAERVLYLDSDLLVCRNLSPLYEVDLQGRAIAAAHDQFVANRVRHLSGKAAEDDRPVFNSGVLLIDLNRMRDGLGERLRAVALQRQDGWPWFDQSVLNGVLAEDDWLEIGPEWNAHDLPPEGPLGYDDAAIIHFAGWKPWQAQCPHPSRRQWRRALRESGWQTWSEQARRQARMNAGLLREKELQLRYRLQIRTRLRALVRSFRRFSAG
jgi:lipopolysaccharide biosynthesis glycosyltransferase